MSTSTSARVDLRPPVPGPRALSPQAARRWAVSLALTAAAFVQAPGVIAGDTKLDLYENPWGLLGRALHLWDPVTASGSLQNQAFGYLFPQGPFYGVLTSAGLPPWVVQRLWWALILVVAFNGAVALLTAMRIGTPSARLVGGIVFALSPRIISAMGEVSSEIWPMAMAPWVLVPLVRQGMDGGDPRRAAARSGVAFLCVGAVNAVASIAVLVLPVLYLLTRRRSRAALRLGCWWVLSIGLVSVWWFVALVLLGKYSPPFLDWIESSAVTTSPASVANSTRGTTAWLAYLAGGRGPTWPAGWTLVTQPIVILDTALLAALGLAGLAWRGLRERLFLVSGAFVGVVLLAVAWDGPFSSPLSATVRTFLDGSGSPLRNIHKFDPVLRVVLVIGLTHLVASVRIKPIRQARWLRNVVPIVACFALLGAVTPLLVGDVGASPGYVAVPDYWRQAAGWLNANAAGGRSLVVPGARPAVYYWGTTNDDVLQPLLSEPWTVRDGVPLGSAGNTRMLDEVEQVLGTGRGSAALAPYLARSGIAYVVERNDIDWARIGVTRPTLVHASLEQSGLVPVAQFGPLIGGGIRGDTVIDGGLGVNLPSVEVWQVPAAPPLVDQLASASVVAGGPENLLVPGSAGSASGSASILAGDAGADRPSVVTDGYRRREVNFGNSRANSSGTMTADEPFRAPRRVHDYWPIPPAGRQSVVIYPNGVPSATTSGAVATAQRNRSNGYGPYQAFDGDLRTGWRSSATTAVGQAVSLTGFTPQAVATVRVVLDRSDGLATVSRLSVTGGDVTTEITVGGDGVAEGSLGGRVVDTLSVSVAAVQPGDDALTVGILEIEFGIASERWVAPAAALGPSTTLRAAVPTDRRDGCVWVDGQALCSADLPRPGEEDAALARRVTVDAHGLYDVAPTARSVGGPALNRLLNPVGAAMLADASSVLVPDPANRPQSAIDRDPATGWIAGMRDPDVSLQLIWPAPVTVTGLSLVNDPRLAASAATVVRLTFDTGAVITSTVEPGGRISLPPIVASAVRITPVELDGRTSVNPVALATRQLPWGVSEIVVEGADGYRRAIDADGSTGVACGFGPTVTVDGVERATRVEASIRDILRSQPVPVILCDDGTVAWSAGAHDITLTASSEFVPDRLELTPVGAGVVADTSPHTAPSVLEWGPTHRVVQTTASSAETLLVVRENANAGWTATLDGAPLVAVRLDGWQQGWRLPAGSGGTVMLDFGPDLPYRAGLGVGLLAALVVVALAVRRESVRTDPVPSRRTPRWASATGAPLVGLILAGLPGLVLGTMLRLVGRRTGRGVLAVVAGTTLTLAGAIAALRPWPLSNPGAFSLTAQLLAVAGVCAVMASGSARRRPTESSTASPHEPPES